MKTANKKKSRHIADQRWLIYAAGLTVILLQLGSLL